MSNITKGQILSSLALAVPYLAIVVLTVTVYPGASWRYDPTSPLPLVLIILASVAVPSLAWLTTLSQGDGTDGKKGPSLADNRSLRFTLILVLAVFFTSKIIQPFPAALIAAVAALAVQAAATTLMGGTKTTPPGPAGRGAAE